MYWKAICHFFTTSWYISLGTHRKYYNIHGKGKRKKKKLKLNQIRSIHARGELEYKFLLFLNKKSYVHVW